MSFRETRESREPRYGTMRDHTGESGLTRGLGGLLTGGRTCAPSAPWTAYAASARRRSAATLSVTHLGCTSGSPAASPYRHLGVDTYPGVTTIVCKG
jgi:hypothetical protein